MQYCNNHYTGLAYVKLDIAQPYFKDVFSQIRAQTLLALFQQVMYHLGIKLVLTTRSLKEP